MNRSSAISSTEQLDRHPSGGSSKDTPPRHKLSVASCIANPLSSSKSSGDLYVSQGAENENGDRPRSRSNSSGPDIEGVKARSRSNSPILNGTVVLGGEDSPVTTTPNTTPCRDSPTLLITPDDSVEPTPSGRRFEKRYHTADGIDVLKPKGSMLSGAILKRFSWNVSSAVGGSSRKRLESSRRSSQASNAASMDSFGSSTSGISTASSSNNENGDAMTLKASHISTIAINDTIHEPQPTLSISLEGQTPVVDELDEETPVEVGAPPPPEIPPPSTTPSPNSTSPAISPPNSKTQKNQNPKHQELLKFIMDNHLETSDV